MKYKYLFLAAFLVIMFGVGLFWLTPPKSSSTKPVMATPSSTTVVTSSTQSVLADTHSTEGATFQSFCAGSVERLAPVNGEQRVLCRGTLTVKAKTTAMDATVDLLQISPTKGDFVTLADVKQIGPSSDPNSRVFLLVEGLDDCSQEFMGCGYNYSIKLKDIAMKTDLRHYEDSNFFHLAEWNWNKEYTKSIGFVGICEGGCIPEPLYGISVERGMWEQLTEQVAFLNQDHYKGRTQEFQASPFTHWGVPVWIDNDRFEVPLYDAQGKLLQLVKGSYRADVENPDYPQFHTK